MPSTLPLALTGVAAGIVGSVVQAAIGKTLDVLLLPESEDSHLAPRLVDRLGRDLGQELSPATEWALGTVFHVGYGATWGMLYAAVDERIEMSPLVGGTLLGSVIYVITFPRWGGAVQTETERPPKVRTRRMTAVAAAFTFSFGLTTAYTARALRERG